MVYRYIRSYLRIDTAKNTEADLLIPGNILYAGLNFISYNTTQDKPSQEIQQNLLISTNETNCKVDSHREYHCGVQLQSAIAIWLPNNIPGISHFHQINSSDIVVIPLKQHCLHIFERTFDKLTSKDMIGECNLSGENDGSNPLFQWPSQSLIDNRNREILYVIDQNNKEIRMVNIADRMAGTIQLQSRFGDKFLQITQAENTTFYISVDSESSSSTNIMSLDLIPLKNASSKYYLTFNRLRAPSFIDFFSGFHKVEQMTWISNHTLIFLEEQRTLNNARMLMFINISAQTQGYININSSLLASFAIDKNLSHHHLQYLILYTWVNDSIFITSSTSTYRLTRQQMQFVINSQDHYGFWDFYWQTSKYLWRMRGAEGKKEKC